MPIRLSAAGVLLAPALLAAPEELGRRKVCSHMKVKQLGRSAVAPVTERWCASPGTRPALACANTGVPSRLKRGSGLLAAFVALLAPLLLAISSPAEAVGTNAIAVNTASVGGSTIAGDPAVLTVGRDVHVYGRGAAGHLIEFYKAPDPATWRVYDLTAFVGE